MRAMLVRSFEIAGADDGDLRKLHDYLLEVGGFEFRAGGTGFFAAVGERFVAHAARTLAQMIIATREDDLINVDVVITGESDGGEGLGLAMRATNLLRGFAERNSLTMTDV